MSSALYGTSTKIPTGGMESQVLKLLLGASMKWWLYCCFVNMYDKNEFDSWCNIKDVLG